LGVDDVTPVDLIADLEAMVTAEGWKSWEKRQLVTKEGRVLSAKNYELVSNCVSSLHALMDASNGKMLSGDSEPEPEDWLARLHKSICK